MHWLDPAYLPIYNGTLAQFTLNPHGDVDGFVLTESGGPSVLVHTPPHLSRELAKALTTGSTVIVRGVRPRDADVIAGVQVTAENGTVITDNGPDDAVKDGDPKRKPNALKNVAVTGTVWLTLFAPKGELRGAILQDGLVVGIDKKAGDRFAALLSPGADIAARGDRLDTKFGSVIDAHELGAAAGSLAKVGHGKPDKPRPHEKHPKPNHPFHPHR